MRNVVKSEHNTPNTSEMFFNQNTTHKKPEKCFGIRTQHIKKTKKCFGMKNTIYQTIEKCFGIKTQHLKK